MPTDHPDLSFSFDLEERVLLMSKVTIQAKEGQFSVSQFLVTNDLFEKVIYVARDIFDWNDIESDDNVRVARMYNEAIDEIGMILYNPENETRTGYVNAGWSAYLWEVCDFSPELHCDEIIEMNVMLYPSFTIYSSISLETEYSTESQDLISFLRPSGYDPLSL
jgi:hypothetical protein